MIQKYKIIMGFTVYFTWSMIAYAILNIQTYETLEGAILGLIVGKIYE